MQKTRFSLCLGSERRTGSPCYSFSDATCVGADTTRGSRPRVRPARLPEGAASFADKVTSFQPGTPLPVEKARDADQALGVPDFHSVQDTGYVSLGRGGVITVEFVDNRLVDVPGNDLYIFEVGPEVESTFVGSVRTERPGPR